MSVNIGMLLPRSGEFPSMAFDLLDGLRLNLKRLGIPAHVHTENIGFGEDPEVTHAAAEKLVLQHDVQFIIAYATSLNAEALYSFAKASNKPFLFLDAGMEIFEADPHPLCYHLTLQGLQACKILGSKAGQISPNVFAASSFFDGGYRGSWAFQEGVHLSKAAITGHFVSHYQPEEFRLNDFVSQLQRSEAKSVTAAFSSYFVQLFMQHLAATDEQTRSIPIFCSPFMADEQLLSAIQHPGAQLNTLVPWATTLNNDANHIFLETIKKEKNKTGNIFHLLGWDAAHAAQRIIEENNIATLDGWSFESPRGTVSFHPLTHNAYAPLYEGEISADNDGICVLTIGGSVSVTPEMHFDLHSMRLSGDYSRWKNNFFCI